MVLPPPLKQRSRPLQAAAAAVSSAEEPCPDPSCQPSPGGRRAEDGGWPRKSPLPPRRFPLSWGGGGLFQLPGQSFSPLLGCLRFCLGSPSPGGGEGRGGSGLSEAAWAPPALLPREPGHGLSSLPGQGGSQPSWEGRPQRESGSCFSPFPRRRPRSRRASRAQPPGRPEGVPPHLRA